jgi:hypothetical protein
MIYDEWRYTRLHQQELLRKAEQNRLAIQARARRKGRFNRMLAYIGGLMVAMGEALHRRYAPAKPAAAPFEPAVQPGIRSTMVTWDARYNSCERNVPEERRGDTSFLKTAHTRRHNPSRKKSNG